MTTVGNRVLVLIFALVLLVVIWGCAQTDDIIARKSLTEIYLTAERIPTAPSGMIYELWVAKNPVTGMNVPASEAVSIGRFSYLANDTISTFLTPGDTARADSNLFILHDDILEYSSLFVTVEQRTDPPGGTPGPVMLVTDISTRASELALTFPLNEILTEDASIAFNMEGVTDGNRSQNDGGGVWFSFYQVSQINLPDTIGVTDSFTVDTIDPIIDGTTGDTLNLDEIHDPDNIDSVIYTFDTIPYFFGRDTVVFVGEFNPPAGPSDSLFHVSVTRAVYTSPDNTFPFTVRNLASEAYDTLLNFVILNVFQPSGFEMPDFTDWGWKYKGWITSTQIPTGWVGQMTLPAWNINPGHGTLIPGASGGLLTTGTFSKIDQPDDTDPFTYKIIDRILDTGGVMDTIYKRPLAPGEDFLDTAALTAAGITGPVDLLPLPNGSTYGSVFITLEPVNSVSDTTNFPLIAFVRAFPNGWPPSGANFLFMINWTSTSQGTTGFPLVKARPVRL